MDKLLIIDDERDICSSLTFALEDKYDVIATVNPLEGLEYLIKEDIALVLLDLKIGQFDGIDLIEEIKNIDQRIQVVMMTAFGSIVSSVDAIKKGAYSYLTKPLSLNILYETIERALIDRSKKMSLYQHGLTDGDEGMYGIIGRSSGMLKVYQYIEKLKDVETSVVISGESGTGKELVARAIHYSGKRQKHKFVEINCAAIPEMLLEEELFGHKKGTFTGAVADKIGKFEFANQGTVFLDEIGDLALGLQAKLLRVLQQREITPLGSNETLKVNVRVIAATNRDLKRLVEEGKFRSDLYFRLNVINIALPPLREKRQDLPLLFKYFIGQYNRDLNKAVLGFSREAERQMIHYDYPGNVRELSNIIESAVLLCKGEWIEVDDLPLEVIEGRGKEQTTEETSGKVTLVSGSKNLAGLTLREAERELIKAALELNGGHRKDTAEMLGISERGLRNKINIYKLKD